MLFFGHPPRLLNVSILIRRADQSDVEFIVGELKEFSTFYATKYPLFPAQASLATDIIQNLVEKQIAFIAVRGDVRLGFISGVLTEHIYNPLIRVFMESFWWVKPIFRGSRAGALLLKAFTDFGKRNADWVIFTLEDKSPVRAKYFLNKGFRPIETNYLLEI